MRENFAGVVAQRNFCQLPLLQCYSQLGFSFKTRERSEQKETWRSFGRSRRTPSNAVRVLQVSTQDIFTKTNQINTLFVFFVQKLLVHQVNQPSKKVRDRQQSKKWRIFAKLSNYINEIGSLEPTSKYCWDTLYIVYLLLKHYSVVN